MRTSQNEGAYFLLILLILLIPKSIQPSLGLTINKSNYHSTYFREVHSKNLR